MSNDTDKELPQVYTAEEYFQDRTVALDATERARFKRNARDLICIAVALFIGIVVIVGSYNETLSPYLLWPLLLIDVALILWVTPSVFNRR